MSECAGAWVGAEKLTRHLMAGVHRRAKFFKVAAPLYQFEVKEGNGTKKERKCLAAVRVRGQKGQIESS